MKNNIRTIIRLVFLFLIFILWANNKVEAWLFVLLAGLLATPFIGRIYCGWVCPVFTAIDIFSPYLKEPKLHRYNKYLQNRVYKTVIFIIFLIIFLLIKKSDFSIPFFILLIPIGLLITILFGSPQWHRICPFGTIFSLPARFSKKGYGFKSRDCSKCGLCVRNCANDCLIFWENSSLYIIGEHCLACGKCKDTCPRNNIFFGKLYNTKNNTKHNQMFLP